MDKNKRLVIIISIICVAVVGAIVVFLAFSDVITANLKFSKIRKQIEACDTVVITDPLYKGDLTYGAEVVLGGDDARKICDGFLSATEKITFDKMVAGGAGFWDTHISFRTDDGVYYVYLKEDGFYIADVNGYLFDIDTECEEEYNELYTNISKLIEEAAK